MKVGRSDLLWNYGASFMRLASGLIVLPVILRVLPSEDVGLWGVMIALYLMIVLLDFGFYTTFSRAITYIFSGANELKPEGFTPVKEYRGINYPLLKGSLKAMRYYYAGIAGVLIIILFTGGYWYIERLMLAYTGDKEVARIAWYFYLLYICYQFYTYYYSALLVGRGMIKKSSQLIVFSQIINIIVAPVLLICGFGIISMVISQTIMAIVNKTLAKRAFYDSELKSNLIKAKAEDWIKIIKTLWVTAYKSGLSSLSVVFTNKMLALFGALFIPLSAIASYSTLSKSVVDLTSTLALVWFATYYPKITHERVKNSLGEVKRLYIKAQLITISVFVFIATGVVLFGDWGLKIIHSSTPFLDTKLLILLFMAALFEALTSLSTSVLISRNAVPHYRAQGITAFFTVALLLITLKYTQMGVTALIVVPFATQLVYQHWRWTLMVMKELNVKFADYGNFLGDLPRNLGLIK